MQLRRWSLRIALTFIILLVVCMAVVQGVLWTNLPRQIVIDQVQKQLGLRLTAGSLSTGWLGHTVLRDVTVALPLADDAFLKVQELDVSTNALPIIVLSGSTQIKSIAIHQPTLWVIQDSAGKWNLQDVALLLARTAGSESAASNANKTSAPKLPDIQLDQARLIIADNTGRTAHIAPINVTGTADSPLTWVCQVNVADAIDVKLRVAPQDLWKHQVSFAVSHLGPLLSPWVKSLPDPCQLNGTWQGGLGPSGLSGRLDLSSVNVAAISASGPLLVNIDANGATIKPAGVIVTSRAGGQRVDLNGGVIALGSTSAQLQSLHASTRGGQADLSGNYIFADGAAELSAVWQDMHLATNVTASGDLHATLAQPWKGQPSVKIALNAHGLGASETTNPDRWESHIQLVGAGRSWDKMDWTIGKADGAATALGLALPNQAYALDDFAAALSTSGQVITLQRLSLGGMRPVVARGEIHLDNRQWSFSATGRAWPLPGTPDTMDTDVAIGNGPTGIHLDKFNVRAGNIRIAASADYNPADPKPLDAHVSITDIDVPANTDLVRGDVQGELHVAGTLDPPDLRIDQCYFHGRDLLVQDRILGDIDVAMTGFADDSHLDLRSTDLNLLGGNWGLHVLWQRANPATHVDLNVAHLPLRQVANLKTKSPMGVAPTTAPLTTNIDGVFTGAFGADVYKADRDHVTIDGQWTIGDLTVSQISAAGTRNLFVADTVEMPSHTIARDGQVSLDGIVARRGDGAAHLALAASLDDLTRLSTTLAVKDWPVEILTGNVSAFASANVAMSVNAKSPARPLFDGNATADVALSYKNQPAAHLSLHGVASGRDLAADSLRLDGTGGVAAGAFSTNLDHLNQSNLRLDFGGITSRDLVAFAPQADEVKGSFHGRLLIAPSTNSHPLDALQLSLNIVGDDARFRLVRFYNLALYAYANLERGDATDGTKGMRFVVDNAKERPTYIKADEGTINLWGRISQNGNDVFQTMVIANFDSLALDALARSGDPKLKPVPGSLAGTVTVVGTPANRGRIFGDGEIKITNADIGNVGVITAMYNLMRLDVGGGNPTGSGNIRFHLEDNALHLTRMYYFNRGVEVRAAGILSDIWAGKECPLSGSALGSIRPLHDIQLPFFADADQILSSIQNSTVTVQIGGKVGKADVNPIPFMQLGNDVRKFLIGDVKSETGDSAE